jgi:hypothetical protein
MHFEKQNTSTVEVVTSVAELVEAQEVTAHDKLRHQPSTNSGTYEMQSTYSFDYI